MEKRGLFITVEGIEGVGKSTAIEFLQKKLADAGVDFIVTREPGGTPIAEEIRAILLADHEELMAPDTELLLVFASRAQHIASVVLPAIERGQWVLCDRFVDASFAYQGGGREISLERIELLAHWVLGGLKPDVTFLLDASPALGLERMHARGKKDRIEKEALEFFDRVRAVYLARAAADPDRFRLVDASRKLPEVQQSLIAELQPLLLDQ